MNARSGGAVKGALALLFALALPAAIAEERAPIEAVTAGGEKVLLLPNGRWQFVDQAKAAEAKKIADQYPENQVRPATAQGGWFGAGRTIMPGDKDYNRGTLNPKMR
jgi:hypothetical protein